ncbi:MAG: hypothetical protein OEW37_09720 [Rhodospirillaceae bacterium]|nr:hypothetical protein [Rhodospirillaceae bacterium]
MTQISASMWNEVRIHKPLISGYGFFAIGICTGLASGFVGILLSA